MADNIYNNFYGGSYQSGDGVVATLLGIIATQKGTIDSLQVQVQDVRAALEGNFDELSDRVANIQETVDKNHKYEIKKFSEMKGLLANLLEKEDANSATLKEMAESIARLEANNGQREENNRLAEETNRLTEENNRLIEENNRLTAENNRLTEAQKRATEESNRRIEALERQLSRLENAFVSATTAGNQQQQQSAGKDDNEVERLDPVFVRGVSAPEHEEIEVRGEDDTSKPDPNPKPEPEPRPVPDPVPEPVPDPVPEPVPEPVPDPVPEPVPEPKPVPEPVSTKNKLKIKLLKKSMDGVRMLAEPKLPWYKRMFNFANRHPVLTTLVGAGIGTALTFLSGPAAFLMAPSMTLTNFIGNYIYVLAGGAVMGLGGGIAASAVSGLVMKGKKGRLYGKFVKQYKKCKSIEMSNERLDSIIDLSQSRAQEMHEKAKEARGPFRGIKKFVNRKLRDANLKVGKIGRVYRQRGQEKYNNQVDSALKTKIRLNELEAKPNRRGKTKSLAIAGYFEKKKRLDSLLERGKITADEYAVRMEDLETDVSQLEGGEPGISSISDKHRTYDKEAWELIESVKGKESDTMRYVRNDISGRHSKVEEVIKDFINPEEAEHDAQALEAEGRANEAKLIRMQVEEQRKEMEKSREISDKYPIVFQEEIITDAEAEETQDDEKTSE